ncbi:MAG: alginate lyase family protein [Terracidiphilus sp.]
MRWTMQVLCLLILAAGPAGVSGGTTKMKIDTRASLIDVAARRFELQHTKSARVATALAQLEKCSKLAPVDAPQGPMEIPRHYLNGSHGATNPAEFEATRVYSQFAKRVTEGMNQFLATGDHTEAACAQAQIDEWAQAKALLDYDAKENPQSWYQVEWTLSTIAISESVLLNDEALDSAVTTRDMAWMNKVAHHMLASPKAAQERNNHHYWRGLTAIATGVISNDEELFGFGMQAYFDGINEIDKRGALPLEMARHELAIHYQSFAVEPLIPIAEFAERQHIPLSSYKSPSGKTIADAIDFLGEAVADPSIVKAYTPETQENSPTGPEFFAALEFYRHRFPDRKLPAAIEDALRQPTMATRLGGNTTVLAGR